MTLLHWHWQTKCSLESKEGVKGVIKYRKVVSSHTFFLGANAGFFRLLMKGFFDPYRHSSISAVSISAILDLLRFIILSYFSTL